MFHVLSILINARHRTGNHNMQLITMRLAKLYFFRVIFLTYDNRRLNVMCFLIYQKVRLARFTFYR